MTDEAEVTTAASEVVLGSRISSADIESLHASLTDAAASDADMTVDVSGVTLIDTPAIQLLMCAARDQARRGRQFFLKGESGAFSEAVSLLGLTQEVNSWSTQ